MLFSKYLKNGAGNEIRTRDPNLGKVVLYQLSYSRAFDHPWSARADRASSLGTGSAMLTGSDPQKEAQPAWTTGLSRSLYRHENPLIIGQVGPRQ